jgi:tetratricopeptide (TPR) repeat protein
MNKKLLSQNWFKILSAMAVVIAIVLIYFFYQKNQSANKPVIESSQEIAIESKGLAEFSPENNTINTVSAQDKKLAGEMMPVLKLMGDGKDSGKNKEAIIELGKIITKYPDYSDTYFLRATISILAGNDNYQQILSDIDNAIKFHSSDKYQSSYDSNAEMYALRAKVDILASNYQQAVNDLETAVKSNPDKINEIFNTGGVKPDENTNNVTALQKKDLDLFIEKYPNDYRAYMFRGLFYNEFSFYDTQYYQPAINDLNKAISINPNSSLAYYSLGTVYQKMATFVYSFKLDGGTSAYDNARDVSNTKALQYFQEAAKDLLFEDAQFQVAESLYSLKRYSEAIPYFDTTIELNPNNAGAYIDRGSAKTYTNDYFLAIDDFSKAIEIKKSKPDSSAVDLPTMYQYRADAYVKTTNYTNAIDDYSRAIGLKFASEVLLMSFPQIRNMYPELKNISDQDLLEGLRQKYFSNFTAKDFSDNYKHNLGNNSEAKKPYQDFILGDLYVSRGDTYLLSGNFKNASKDYSRAVLAGSSSITDRWRFLSKNIDGQYYIDAQTLDFSQGNLASLWVKTTNNSGNYDEQNYQIDCSGKKIKSLSATSYDISGNVINTIGEQEWQSVVPDSIGEILYNGMCK